jgi:hypothetical protein
MEPNEVKELLPSQKVNWIPGMPELCWKHLLHSNIELAKSRFGEAAFSFWPSGWNLPEDYDKLKAFYEARTEEEERETPIILKPSMQACGNGIRCITSISQLPPDDPFLNIKSVAQYYIPNPLLLDGFKVTFRIYVLITSLNPLRAYIYPNGLGRICSHRFTNDLTSFQDLFAHLTNYDINKHNLDEFLQEKGEGMSHAGLATDGLRTDFMSVMDYLRRQGKDTDAIWHAMKRTTALTLLAADEKIASIATKSVRYRSSTFEILGFDFLIDDELNPWILEVNHAPNLEPHTALETELKRGMIRDALHLADVCRIDTPDIYHSTNALMETIEALSQSGASIDDQLVLQGVPPAEEQHQHQHQQHLPSASTTFPLSTLTRLEAWTLVEGEKESKRLGAWQPVFPLDTSDEELRMKEVQTGESLLLHHQGFGGRRNDLAVKFLQLGKTVDEIIFIGRQALEALTAPNSA